MNELERELSRHLAEPRDIDDTGFAGRMRSGLEARSRGRRKLAIAAAAATLAAAAIAALVIWKLGEAALAGWDTTHGISALLLLPFVAVVAIVGLAAYAVAGAILRPRR